MPICLVVYQKKEVVVKLLQPVIELK